MTYSNPLMTELMVPRGPEVAGRIHGFYEDIGWDVRDDSDSTFFTYTNPKVSEGQAPTIGYWQTETGPDKADLFVVNDVPAPSEYSTGLRLPNLQQLVEVCLVVPSDEDVHAIFERGGTLLQKHAHIPPRDHAGRQEFRFSDPFNHSLRVTGNPGWEIVKPPISEEFLAEITDQETNKLIAAVNYEGLRDFAVSQTGNPHLGESAWNALRRYVKRDSDGLKEFYVEGAEGVGLRPERIRDLTTYLRAGKRTFKPLNYGQKSEELLLALHHTLFPEEDPDKK